MPTVSITKDNVTHQIIVPKELIGDVDKDGTPTIKDPDAFGKIVEDTFSRGKKFHEEQNKKRGVKDVTPTREELYPRKLPDFIAPNQYPDPEDPTPAWRKGLGYGIDAANIGGMALGGGEVLSGNLIRNIISNPTILRNLAAAVVGAFAGGQAADYMGAPPEVHQTMDLVGGMLGQSPAISTGLGAGLKSVAQQAGKLPIPIAVGKYLFGGPGAAIGGMLGVGYPAGEAAISAAKGKDWIGPALKSIGKDNVGPTMPGPRSVENIYPDDPSGVHSYEQKRLKSAPPNYSGKGPTIPPIQDAEFEDIPDSHKFNKIEGTKTLTKNPKDIDARNPKSEKDSNKKLEDPTKKLDSGFKLDENKEKQRLLGSRRGSISNKSTEEDRKPLISETEVHQHADNNGITYDEAKSNFEKTHTIKNRTQMMRALHAIAGEKGLTHSDISDVASQTHKVDSLSKLSDKELHEIYKAFDSLPDKDLVKRTKAGGYVPEKKPTE